MRPKSVAKPESSTNAPPPEFYNENDSDNVCFLCGDPKYTPTYEVKHFGFPFRFQRCQCGLEKQTPMPNEKFFEWFFNSDVFFTSKTSTSGKIWGYYDYFKDEPSRLATSRLRYRRLRDVFEVGRPLSVMKIGPSTGTMLYTAKQHGHRVRGCDVSSQFAEYARSHYDVEIDNGRFEKMPYEDGQFDVLLLLNVIENVPNLDEFMTAIGRTVKTGGHLVLNYVDMKRNLIAKLQKERYFLYRPPVCYSLDGPVLEKLLGKYGFKTVRRMRDIRYLHLQKIFSLLDWPLALKLIKVTKLDRIKFPLWAYPSWIIVAEKI